MPRLLRLETDPEPLGATGFVMERIEGRVPPDVMPYTYGDNWLYAATGTERDHLEQATVEVLAGLHAVPAEGEAGFLAADGTAAPAATSPLRRHVEEQRAYYAGVVEGRPASPLIGRAFARLEQLWPQDEGPSVLSWGDARIGNIIYQGFDPVGVLDWEMASLGPRELDLAWLIFLHRFFQDLTESSGLPGMPDFLERGRVCARYAELTGHNPARPGVPPALRGASACRGDAQDRLPATPLRRGRGPGRSGPADHAPGHAGGDGGEPLLVTGAGRCAAVGRITAGCLGSDHD